MDNQYMAERSNDYQDVADRLLAHITNQKDNVLIIPLSYIQKKKWKSFVLVKTKWKTILREIKTWISNEMEIEVLEWLKEGDIVVKQVASKNIVDKNVKSGLIPWWKWMWWKMRK